MSWSPRRNRRDASRAHPPPIVKRRRCKRNEPPIGRRNADAGPRKVVHPDQREENEMKTLHTIGAAIVMSALVAGAATAAQMKAAGPQPGDCKQKYEAI